MTLKDQCLQKTPAKYTEPQTTQIHNHKKKGDIKEKLAAKCVACLKTEMTAHIHWNKGFLPKAKVTNTTVMLHPPLGGTLVGENQRSPSAWSQWYSVGP